MPRLKIAAPTLRREGPAIDIQIQPVLAAQEAMRADGEEVPSVSVKALIDTGASGTLIQTSIVGTLGLDWIGTVLLTTPSTTKPLVRYEYRVRIVLSETIAFETDAVEGDLIGQNIQCLIGRDVLEYVVFTYDGPNSRFSIALK
jgi:hypothetical protein